MSSTQSHDDRSQPALPAERLMVLEKLLGKRRAESSRFLKEANREGLSLQDLWKRVDSRGLLVAAGLLASNPGRTAALAISPIQSHEQASEVVALIQAMTRHALGAGNIDLIQYLAEPNDDLEIDVLKAAGFLDLAVLVSMERNNSRNAKAPAAIAHVRLTSEAIADADMLALLRETYVDSLDCPGLSKLRHEKDILDGHRRGGNFDQQLWSVMQINGVNAGVSIVNRTPAADCIEIAYFGLAQFARGKGFGAYLLDHPLFLAAKHCERSIMLAVDERNSPALRLYVSRGFHVVTRRVALALSSLKSST
ncbi:hypothetical protein LBMAG50_08250 [Phycisphaerae bacterium]|nr:hypothetical protein LBMAG50_08250 [Phycisphaerae bacterium]